MATKQPRGFAPIAVAFVHGETRDAEYTREVCEIAITWRGSAMHGPRQGCDYLELIERGALRLIALGTRHHPVPAEVERTATGFKFIERLRSVGAHGEQRNVAGQVWKVTRSLCVSDPAHQLPNGLGKGSVRIGTEIRSSLTLDMERAAIRLPHCDVVEALTSFETDSDR